MNELIKTGRKRTILISMSILLVSLHTIYYYQMAQPELDTKKLTQQIIRFVLTVGLLVAVYRGKKWAKIVSLVLFSLGILVALIALTAMGGPFMAKLPLLVATFIYSVAIYHFGFSRSFQAFSEYQNGKVIRLDDK